MAKKWQELKGRGGPYTAEELRILNTRPGMTAISSNAWECETCGRISGQYTSGEYTAHLRATGKLLEPVKPEPPADVRALDEAWQRHEAVLQGVTKDLAEAQVELSQARRAVNEDAERRRLAQQRGRDVDTARETRHRAMVDQAEARVQQLQQAHQEAAQARNVALQEYMTAYAAFRRRVREEEQAKRTPAPEPKQSALDRWLGGKKSA